MKLEFIKQKEGPKTIQSLYSGTFFKLIDTNEFLGYKVHNGHIVISSPNYMYLMDSETRSDECAIPIPKDSITIKIEI